MRDYVPEKRKQKTYKQPWVNKSTAAVIDRKRRAWIKYSNCNNNENYQMYQQARNVATNNIRYAKRDYERNIAIKSKDEPKLFWNYVRSHTKTREQVANLKQVDGTITDDPSEKANILNSFFSSVFTKEDTENIPELSERYTNESLDTVKIEQTDTLKAIRKLKQSKSPGPDGIHNKILIETSEYLLEPLTKLFNKSMNSGKIPSEWKKAHVTPIFKSGDKHAANNYRPVSLTSIM